MSSNGQRRRRGRSNSHNRYSRRARYSSRYAVSPRRRGRHSISTVLRWTITIAAIVIAAVTLHYAVGWQWASDLEQSARGRYASFRADQQARKSEKLWEVVSEVHYLINVERAQHGLHPLQWDDALGKIAYAHSADMVEHDYFSHDNLRGEDPTDRAERSGYHCRKSLGAGRFSVGLAENLALQPRSSNLPSAAVAGWMDSPGHRANILDHQYDRTGIGIAFGYASGYGDSYYLTQVFC